MVPSSDRKKKINDTFFLWLFFHFLPHSTNHARDIWAPLVCEVNTWEEENVCFAVLGHLVFSFQHAEVFLSCGSHASSQAATTKCFRKIEHCFLTGFEAGSPESGAEWLLFGVSLLFYTHSDRRISL